MRVINKKRLSSWLIFQSYIAIASNFQREREREQAYFLIAGIESLELCHVDVWISDIQHTLFLSKTAEFKYASSKFWWRVIHVADCDRYSSISLLDGIIIHSPQLHQVRSKLLSSSVMAFCGWFTILSNSSALFTRVHIDTLWALNSPILDLE